jgi:predicted GH43/DUF377 family glycosyl hydrolase
MNAQNPPQFHYLKSPAIIPQHGVPWADTMVLNPAIFDQSGSDRLHMLFRATGPWPTAKLPDKPLPYPIFLGYATSDDNGKTWHADFSKPALAPALAMTPESIQIIDRDGRPVVNYANGCTEDPRFFRLEDKSYVSVACRMFPPGPYWDHDDPMQCAPAWATGDGHKLGRAARENMSVTVLFEVDTDALLRRDYSSAFHYVTPISNPELGDNRDVFLFPGKFHIGGREKYLCLHRPMDPSTFGPAYKGLPPAIFLAAAEKLEDLAKETAEHRLLARSEFTWEGNRVGASWVPIQLSDDEWLLPYHGKQDSFVGYTQSFMILKTGDDGWPVVAHRCPDRLMYAQQDWELRGRFTTPCLFTCGGMVRDGKLLMSYGAADTVVGTAWVDFAALIAYLRHFDEHGNRIG